MRAGWRPALAGLGALTAACSLLLLLRRHAVLPALPPAPGDPGETRADGERRGFGLLLLAGGLDSATQGAALTFLPFVFAGQGQGSAAIGLLFSLIFGAGAAGKFLCGWLTDRWGTLAVIVVTEAVTAATLVAFVSAPARFGVPLALAFGFVLSGTSSALTTAVTRFVPAARRARGYGAYFTAALTSGAVAPLAYGALTDAVGLDAAFLVMAAFTAIIVPTVLPIRRALTTTP